jgi:hypothetical protein
MRHAALSCAHSWAKAPRGKGSVRRQSRSVVGRVLYRLVRGSSHSTCMRRLLQSMMATRMDKCSSMRSSVGVRTRVALPIFWSQQSFRNLSKASGNWGRGSTVPNRDRLTLALMLTWLSSRHEINGQQPVRACSMIMPAEYTSRFCTTAHHQSCRHLRLTTRNPRVRGSLQITGATGRGRSGDAPGRSSPQSGRPRCSRRRRRLAA